MLVQERPGTGATSTTVGSPTGLPTHAANHDQPGEFTLITRLSEVQIPPPPLSCEPSWV
jgi:hypothetical protein